MARTRCKPLEQPLATRSKNGLANNSRRAIAAWSASIGNLLSSKSPTGKEGTKISRDTFTSISEAHTASLSRDSPQPPPSRSSRPSSRPMSIVQPYQPPLLEVEQDTLPELQPVFTFLNSHSKKIYTEGYFLKLNDLNPDGKPSQDRSWVECFAQLVGTVLSLWDATQLDAAGHDGEVVPTYLNLTDASIKMIDTLPTRSPDVPPLTNVLSISTAGRNRYLFHFNSHHSLTQWTAGIRLCMFEHSCLQEAYTGALIAGKGKTLNSINTIMERARFKYEDWARVRFGAGTPWRRCWAVITPPDEKSVKRQKAILKKANKSAYNAVPFLKGDIKFYENKKSKKSQPIATITDAFSAYAIYPQSKPLIEQSTLVKIEGKITINSDHPTTSEGFVFVMPESHPAVSGFEIMLRWLFPTFDVFGLYGRPGRLIAGVDDPKGLMFAMPRERQYGYLQVEDIVGLIVTEGGSINSESEWRLKLKELTAAKIKNGATRARPRTSLPAGQRFPGVTFRDDSSGSSSSLPIPASQIPPQHVPMGTPPLTSAVYHQRSTSESTGYLEYQRQQRGPPSLGSMAERQEGYDQALPTGRSDSSSDDSLFQGAIDPSARRLQQQTSQPSPDLVPATPIMMHSPSSKPPHMLPQMRSQGPSHDLQVGLGVHQDQDLPRRSTESNLFDGMPLRSGNTTGADPALPPSAFPPSLMSNGSAPTSKQISAMYPPPPPPLLPSQQSQITAQSYLPYQSLIEPPPGFAPQYSQVLLAGPPPTNDRKEAYEEGYANRPPPPPVHKHPVGSVQSMNPPPLSRAESLRVEEAKPPRFSWQDTDVPTPVQLTSGREITAGSDPQPPPPIPANALFKRINHPTVPGIQTNVGTKPPPEQFSAAADDSPTSAELASLAQHMISDEALNRIGTDHGTGDEDTLDRKRAQRMQRMLTDSGSEYEDDDEPDYSSIHTTREEPPKRDADMPRAGVMKVVGGASEPEVVVGDARYRPSTSGQIQDSPEIPKVDFGTTINHGRTLSAESRGVSRGNAQIIDQDEQGPHSLHGTLIGGDPRRQSMGLSGDLWGQNRAPSRSSGASEERRESWNRPSPDSVHERAGSHGSESGESKRRSVVWQPGMAQVGGGRSPDRRDNAEQYVAEKAAAAAAQHQSRSRYVHQRKTSGTSPTSGRNPSAEHLPRPASRGGEAAFASNGLASGAVDISNHLSAREQEYVAKQTGSTLLYIDNAKHKQLPHRAGLLGAIEARELEKRKMRESWTHGGSSDSATVQQAIAQRQQQKQQQKQQQQQQQSSQRSSPRGMGSQSPGFTQYGGAPYLPLQQQQAGFGYPQQPPQSQQYQQQYFGRQPYGQPQYGQQQPGQGGFAR
ncbi:unnamed protein product [Tuber melanosporum]|uniref:(Perigord truffle) hypothetical protein n=1 Tax=Tuber melanosporum (strain Mel28) TaxID=656061 RepID=D5GJ20_TUBMM|nr:uncharacterized protein GSTUM_00008784001 [Tuber melanosporum]CAZ84513.1 unnamed protein product [Tuber melanosporum]